MKNQVQKNLQKGTVFRKFRVATCLVALFREFSFLLCLFTICKIY